MLSVKSVKEFPGSEGKGVSCKVLWNDKHVADFIDYGDGGESRLEMVEKAGFEAAVAAYPKTLPTGDEMLDSILSESDPTEWSRTLRLVFAIDDAINVALVEKKIIAATKRGQLIFRTPEQKAHEYYTIKTTDRERTMARMRVQHPGALFFVADGKAWAWHA
jgi:hypothetical protein